ncbi:MbnP family protein [Hymenobacter telluris]|nr:MbnP family protein [Hymenobacter telluris]
MEFENVAGSTAIQLNSTTPYTTAAGDQFTITTLRYYISNIKLKRADGTEFVQPDSYYLIDQGIESSRKFSIPNVPIGDYSGITFTVGVDSVRNVSGAQTGALSPGDMFWTWNSGYIYTKLEGRSPQSSNLNGGIIFHIGGFKSPNNTIRTVSPAMNNNMIQVREGRTPEVHFKADVLKMFTGPNTIRFAASNNIMGGPDAVKVANNQAAGMFTLDHIHGN